MQLPAVSRRRLLSLSVLGSCIGPVEAASSRGDIEMTQYSKLPSQ